MLKNYAYLLLFFWSGMVFGQIDRTQQPPSGPAPKIELGDPHQFQLDNGLNVIVVENHKLPRVNASLSIDSPPLLEGEKMGYTSLASDLMGKGTQLTAKDQFNDEVDFMGASITFSSLGAQMNCLSRYFDKTLRMMAEGLLLPKFTEEELEKSRAIHSDGLKAMERDVSAAARRVENALAYGTQHPRGEFLTQESLNKVQLADIQHFYETYFSPKDAYLVIVGDVKVKAVQKLVRELFDDWKVPKADYPSLAKVENPKQLQLDFVEMSNAVQTEISLQNTYHLSKKDPDYFPLIMANAILGSGGDGRLFLNLREDKAFTYGAYSRVGNDKYTASRFRASTQVRNSVVDSAIVELIAEVDRIRTKEVSADELNRAKAKYIGSFVRALENPATVASYALEIRTEGLPKDFYQTYLEKINAVTQADVLKAAQKYFQLDHARIVVTGKAAEVLEPIEKVTYKGKPLKVHYYDKYAGSIARPSVLEIPAGLSIDQVMDAHEVALGGKEKLASVQSIENYMETENPMVGGILIVIKQMQGHMLQEVILKSSMSSMMKAVISPEESFMVQQGQQMKMPADAKKGFQTLIDDGFFGNIAKIRAQGKLVGIETSETENVYKITLPNEASDLADEFYFGVETGYLLRSIITADQIGQKIRVETLYSDFKSFGGIMFPGTTESPGANGIPAEVMTLKNVKINSGLTAEDFK